MIALALEPNLRRVLENLKVTFLLMSAVEVRYILSFDHLKKILESRGFTATGLVIENLVLESR